MAIKILQVVTSMNRGGIESLLMNFFRNIDTNVIQFDFLTHRPSPMDYEEEILAGGGKVYHLPRLNPLSPSYRKALNAFFKEHPEYKIVHSHLDCISSIVLKAAKRNGVKVCIAHAHNSNQERNLKYPIKLYYRNFLSKYADYNFACGKEAGDWMFNGKPYQVIKNSIDAKKYAPDEETRRHTRKSLGINEDAVVIGHVGRFMVQKNHKFIIDVFEKFHGLNKNSVLLLVGEGPLMEETKAAVQQKGLGDKVIFTGVCSNVEDMLGAMDLFLFPSLFEGLPLAIIEAQASGLPCVISDKVPSECDITGTVASISLNDTAEKWAEKINVILKNSKRADTYESIKNAGFDINGNAQKLTAFYVECYNSTGASTEVSTDAETN